MTDDLEEYWRDLRQGRPRVERAYPQLLKDATLSHLTTWAKYPNVPFQVVPGDDRHQAVAHLVKQLGEDTVITWPTAWNEGALPRSLTSLIRNLVIPSSRRHRPSFMFPLPFAPENREGWDLIWGLVGKTDFVIEDPLKGLVEKRFSRLSDMYRLLMEARFVAREMREVTEPAIHAIGRWLEGSTKAESFFQDAGVRRPLQDEEAIGVLLFVLTLASQNGLLPINIFVLDGLERMDRRDATDLHHVLAALERWVPIGCPFRVLLLWDGLNRNALSRLNPKLSKQVRAGLSWIR